MIPFDYIATVHEAAAKKHAAETAQMENIRAGRNDRAWVDAALAKLGCEIEA